MRRKKGTFVIDADFAAAAAGAEKRKKEVSFSDDGVVPMEIGGLEKSAAVFRRHA